jgi:hypothetical protein
MIKRFSLLALTLGLILMASSILIAEDILIQVYIFRGTRMEGQPGLKQVEFLLAAANPEISSIMAKVANSEALLRAVDQTVIENPAKPLSGNAGRVVTLKEEVRIEDTGGGFFFKNPYAIRVSPKGDIFIQDGQQQALQFDPQGRFVRNLFKKGQGPGELTSILDIWASRDRLFLLGDPPKILVYDHDGNLVKELSLRDLGRAKFVQADTGSLLIKKSGWPDPSAGVGLRDIPQDIIEIAPDGTTAKSIGSFPIRGFVQVYKGGGTGMTTWNQLQAVSLDGNTLFLNHTPEYLVETFVRDKDVVVLRFKRPYSRVKRSGGGVSEPGGPGTPPPKFKPDIYALHVVDGKLWVQTSTVVAGKGILFDVFDTEGRYIDNFFVLSLKKDPSDNLANMRLTIADGFAYFMDKTEGELLVVKKCRLVGF